MKGRGRGLGASAVLSCLAAALGGGATAGERASARRVDGLWFEQPQFLAYFAGYEWSPDPRLAEVPFTGHAWGIHFPVAAVAEPGRGRVFAVSDNAFHDDCLIHDSGNLALFAAGLAWVAEPANERRVHRPRRVVRRPAGTV